MQVKPGFSYFFSFFFLLFFFFFFSSCCNIQHRGNVQPVFFSSHCAYYVCWYFLKVIIGHKCVARLTASFLLSAWRVVVVRGRSLFHHWMGSDFLSLFLFLSAKRAESSGCESLFAFPSVDGEWFLSVCLFLKNKIKSQTKMTASVLKQEKTTKFEGFVLS